MDYAEQLFSEELDPEKYHRVLTWCNKIFKSSTENMITVINEFEKIANLVYPGKKDCEH